RGIQAHGPDEVNPRPALTGRGPGWNCAPCARTFSPMAACPECGRENADDARFCSHCGETLTARSPERRKQATLLFCDVVGSTALGERIDPEAVREFMVRYFE